MSKIILEDGFEIEKSEWQLRRLLCSVYAGAMAYMDDGEASDGRALPSIDFIRDDVATIKAKMVQRVSTSSITPKPTVPMELIGELQRISMNPNPNSADKWPFCN